jgi:glycosyltransferase involved in cell wall biosynthesis
MPLAKELAKRIGGDRFAYIVTQALDPERRSLGWSVSKEPWCYQVSGKEEHRDDLELLIKKADIAYFGDRWHPLLYWRLNNSLPCVCSSERWFKPPWGLARLFQPNFFKMCILFVAALRKGKLYYFPQGLHAAADMVRLVGLLQGSARCCFSLPVVSAVRNRPVSQLVLADEVSDEVKRQAEQAYCLDKMRLWGYFVEKPSNALPVSRLTQREWPTRTRHDPLRVFWAGRLLKWKRVDTLIRAVGRLLEEGGRIHLSIVGEGPDRGRLQRMARRYLTVRDRGTEEKKQETSGITFQPPVQIGVVRQLMRMSHIYVLSSNGYEGWGAVVNEAMGEGCCVVATHESGSAATMIEHGVNGFLFHAGDVEELADTLRKCAQMDMTSIGRNAKRTINDHWSPDVAAEEFIRFIGQVISG